MLQSVFGSSTMADAENARRNSAKCTVDSNIREQLQGIAKNVIHNQKIVETRKFAGQEITYVNHIYCAEYLLISIWAENILLIALREQLKSEKAQKQWKIQKLLGQAIWTRFCYYFILS